MSRPVAEVGSTASSYEILAKLATGGMAEIFLARGASTAGVERYVVLKRVLAHHANNPEFVQMFLDEARLAAQLQHPNIAQVFDVGKLSDSYFFTMEYVHGETVRGLLQRSHGLRRPLPLQTVLTVGAGAAAGLHHAHTRNGLDGRPLGIVHRDISPSNLMVSYEGAVKVVDFGVAKAAHRSHETRSGAVKGKISYLSPEQCRGSDVDRRSDIYSLGIVMWEMLTTERLYKQASDFETMSAIVTEPAPPPSSRRPEIPRELDGIVLRCLAKSPADRFQTADELHEEMEQVAVRMGMALSATSLGRFMRDLFGQRPEPWIELQTREAHPEVVTITSESIGGPTPISMSAAQPPGPTVPLPAQIAPMNMTIMGHTPPRAHSPSLTPSGPSVPSIQHTPSQGAVLPVMPAVARVGSYSQSVSAYAQQQQGQGQGEGRRVPRAVLVLGPAVVIGIIIGIVVAVGGGKEKAASGKGSGVTVTSTVPAADPTTTTTTNPTTTTATATATITDPTTTTKTTTNPTTTTNSGSGSGSGSAEAETGSAAEVTQTKTVEKTHRTKVVPPVPQTVEDMVRAGKHADAVKACAADLDTLDKNTSACVVAACHTRDTTKARKWFAFVASPSKRASLVATCNREHIALEAPKATGPSEECKHDPMACPH